MLGRIVGSPSLRLRTRLAAFVIGIAGHAIVERSFLPPVAWLVLPALALLAALVRERHGRFLLVTLIIAASGFARYDLALGSLRTISAPSEGGTLTGTVRGEPRVGVRGATITVDRVRDASGTVIDGRIIVHAPLASGLADGDVVAWRCRPAPLSEWDIDRFFVARVTLRCFTRDPPRLVERGPFTPRSVLSMGKDRLRASVAALVPEPEASIVMGLLVGDKGGIPEETMEAFRRTGTSHVLAVSGYNVTLVVEFLVVGFAIAGLRRRRASAAVAALVWAFAIFVGGDAPVVRAAAMGTAALLAGALGRRSDAAVSLLIAAAAMLAANPFLLRYDVGFRLSFSAVIGLHALGPLFANWLRIAPAPGFIRTAAAETLAATIATLPITLHDIGVLPLAAPLANLFVVPLVPIIMLFGAAAAVSGLLWAPLGIPAAFVATWLTRGIETLIVATSAVIPAPPMRIGAFAALALAAWLIVLRYAFAAHDDRHAS